MKIRRAQVCGSEVHIFHFHHPLIRECVLGHEFIGEIAALGEGMETDFAGNPVQIGDRVIAPTFSRAGDARRALRGDFNLCQRAYSFWSNPPEEEPHFTGAFATHYYVHPDQYLYKVPDNVSDKVVAGANCGLSQVCSGCTRSSRQATVWWSRARAASVCMLRRSARTWELRSP